MPMSDKVKKLVEQFGAWEIIMSRFVYGTRIASSLFWGIQGLSFARFAFFDVIGCVLWASLLIGLGFFMSNSAQALIGKIKAVERWLLVALVVTIGILLIREVFIRKSKI